MSQDNVETFKRAVDAFSRRDVEALLEELDPDVEWHPLLQTLLSGEAAFFRGHEGVRGWARDFDAAFTEFHAEYPDIRDLGDRVVAIGRFSARGRASGVETASPIGYLIDFENGKVTRVVSYLDPEEALAAAAGSTEASK